MSNAEKDIITCVDELARCYGYPSPDSLCKAFQNPPDPDGSAVYTHWDTNKITLSCYVDGAGESQFQTKTVYFPFTIEEFERVKAFLEEEVEELSLEPAEDTWFEE